MATTTWWTVVTALRTALLASPGMRAPDARTDGTTVFVGRAAELTEERGDYIILAWSGDPGQERSPGGSEQVTAPLAAEMGRPRDETGTIECQVVTYDGDTDLEEPMSRAMSIVGVLEGLVRADPTLGIAARRMWVELMSMDVQPTMVRGAGVVVDVSLRFRARI